VGLDRSRLLTHISSLMMILIVIGSAMAMWSDSLKIKTVINTRTSMLNLDQYRLMILQEQQIPHMTRTWAHATLANYKLRMRIMGIQLTTTI
jgi:hypothetical protein